jgi:folate-binding protein YgfZ
MFSRDQYDAAHSSAVTIDPGLGAIVMTGADRAAFLHALLTNDIARLSAGHGAYAAYLTPQGRMISDMRVIETGTRILLGVERPLAAGLAARLDALVFAEDVQVTDASGRMAVAAVHGPSAAAVIQRATGVPVAGLAADYDNVTSDSLTIVRETGLGMPGFHLYVASADADALRSRLRDAGAVDASAETAETLRIEAGQPRFGVDMNTDTIPLEAGIEDRAISFTKGCYVGQEVIVRVMHRGHGRVARRLVSLLMAGAQVPAHGDTIAAGDRQVGEITSATDSPKHGSPLALGYVQRDYAAPGTGLTVNGSEARVYQTVD